MLGMKAWLALSLAFLTATVGAVGASTTAPVAPAKAVAGSAPAEKAGPGNTVTVHRCVDAKGLVTLQGDPCPPGSKDTAREMTRPKDPPPGSTPPPPPIIIAPPQEEEIVQRREIIPPPPMYRCTNPDGEVRYTEQYDPNPRCEPIVLYFPFPGIRQPSSPQALSCRWIEDSCVKLSDWEACQHWQVKRKEAASAILHAFSDTAAYRRSELARANQILNDNCR